MFDPRFFDVDALIASLTSGILPFAELNGVAAAIQRHITTMPTIEKYALDLCDATRNPAAYGITIEGVDLAKLILSGVSPRGMGMLMRAAKVAAWLNDREALVPEDIHAVWHETIAHRIFFNPVYELRRADLIGALMEKILDKVVSP